MLKTIVVPMDGSALAERALSLATALSIPTAARLVLVRVSPDEPTTDDVSPCRAYLEKTAAELQSRGFCVEAVPATGQHVAQAIIEVAQAHHADVIVMTTHGRTGPARWLLGSVAETLVKCSQVPVLLQRAWDPERRAILMGGAPTILVTVDGSRFAEAALPPALDLADDLGGQILLVGVDPESQDILQAEQDVVTSMNADAYEPLVAIHTYLDELAARLGVEQPTLTVTAHIECGDPATAIIGAAEESGAALVVMATHGRTGLQRLALGSVADAVLRHGRTPLMLVHPTAGQAAHE